MPTLLPVAACLLIATGYLVLAVHYGQEAREIHLHHGHSDVSVTAKAVKPINAELEPQADPDAASAEGSPQAH